MKKGVFLTAAISMLMSLGLSAFMTTNVYAKYPDKVTADTTEINLDDYHGKSIYISDESKRYVVTGSTYDSCIVINCGTSKQPVEVWFEDVKMDLHDEDDNDDSVEAAPITCTEYSYVHMYFTGDNYLYGGNDTGWGDNDGYPGIMVGPRAHVTLDAYSKATLEAHGGDNGSSGAGAAGIGGCSEGATALGDDVHYENIGELTIKGELVVRAYGGGHAAGIGGGRDGNVDTINIQGNADIEAYGGNGAAGIGPGDDITNLEDVTLNEININGGKRIYAKGQKNGAGIGGSQSTKITGKISIYGKADIEAYGGENAAGIGAGDDNENNNGSAWIDIKSDGKIYAQGGEKGAGIGGGKDGEEFDITIGGSGNITAIGGDDAAGIGASYNGKSKKISISGNAGYTMARSLTIYAEAGGHDAAAIGSGKATAGDISISNAVVTVKQSTAGAGIGSGENDGLDKGEIENISISNCSIKVITPDNTFAPGIGAGYGGVVKNISLYNSDYEGNSIGSSWFLNNFFGSTPNDMDSIVLDRCGTIKVTAKPDNGSDGTVPMAGIGPGVFGDIDKIEIKNCDHVEVKGANGGAGIGTSGQRNDLFAKWVSGHGGDIGSLTIENCTYVKGVGTAGKSKTEIVPSSEPGEPGEKKLTASFAGAGLGSGSQSRVDSIQITNCDYVEGIGGSDNEDRGAGGIGSGGLGACGKITIKDCKTVIGTGGFSGAGIGSGGVDCTLLEYGEPEDNFWTEVATLKMYQDTITIENCENVTATGGKYGTGIGPGESADMDGDIIIKDSNVVATGGYRAAGIGTPQGIDCEKQIHISGTGTIKATGGKEGAGIGSGYYADKVNDILIEGCEITATGGLDAAGIGFGKNKKDKSDAKFNKLTINGGVLTVKAGGDSSDDIGCGAGYHISGDQNFRVNAGTVWAEKWAVTPVIDGGSINAVFANATNSQRTNVYQVKAKLLDAETYAKFEEINTAPYYGTKDIKSDDASLIYLYLPKSDENETTAQVTYASGNREGKVFEYVGTSKKDNTGWLKMALPLEFIKPDEEPIVGGKKTIYLDTSKIEPGTAFEFSMADGSKAHIVSSRTTAPDTSVTIEADDFGEYKIIAEGKALSDESLYWGFYAEYKGNITVAPGEVTFAEDIVKIFDGTKVDNPEVTKNSDGEVSYTYFDKNGNQLDGAPIEAGEYSVTATLAATEHYTKDTCSMDFEILKRTVAFDIKAKEDNEKAYVYVDTKNLVDGYTDGSVDIVIRETEDQDPIFEKTVSVEEAKAGIEFDKAAAGLYMVSVQFVNPVGHENYEVNKASKTFDKSKAERDVDVVSEFHVTYGDEAFKLNAAPSEGTGEIKYEIIADIYDVIDAERSIDVSEDGTVTILHAGTSMIEITISDPEGVYDDAFAYVNVFIDKATLSVKSYACDKNDENLIVTEVPYGQVDSVDYKLEYEGFVNGDAPDTFTNGHGILKAVGPNVTTPVSKGNSIRIARDLDGKKLFYSRDYNIEGVNGTINIVKTNMTLRPSDLTVTKGDKEPTYELIVEGIVPWDSLEAVFGVEPKAVLDEAASGGKYKSLAPGVYKDAIIVVFTEDVDPLPVAPSVNDGANGSIITDNYNISVEAGTLTIKAKPVKPQDDDDEDIDNGGAEDDSSPETADGSLVGFAWIGMIMMMLVWMMMFFAYAKSDLIDRR